MFHAEFELTNHCNTRCLHCPHEVMSRPRGRLERKTYETVTEKIRKHFPDQRLSYSFSGMGEPLLHPQIFQFVRHVSDHAFTSFASNGSALTERNVAGLIEAGLDLIYFSFNGDEPALFEKMMGGLSFDHVLKNLRRAVAMSQGTRLRISANISVTKANRDRLTPIKQLLSAEGITDFSYAMAHTRGGNMRDPEVFDTPPLPQEVTHCEVLKNTLFIDWRGRVLICDHDLHGEYGLGDLVSEPIATVLERRQRLIDNGVSFKICGECNDVLKMGTDLFPDRISGTLRDWIYDVYREADESPLPNATSQMKWLYGLYQRENRVDRMVDRLLGRSRDLERLCAESLELRDKLRRMDTTVHDLNRAITARDTEIHERNLLLIARDARIAELATLASEREDRIREMERERQGDRQLFAGKILRLEKRLRRWIRGRRGNG